MLLRLQVYSIVTSPSFILVKAILFFGSYEKLWGRDSLLYTLLCSFAPFIVLQKIHILSVFEILIPLLGGFQCCTTDTGIGN